MSTSHKQRVKGTTVTERVKQKRSDLPRLLLEPAACARQKGNSESWPLLASFGLII